MRCTRALFREKHHLTVFWRPLKQARRLRFRECGYLWRCRPAVTRQIIADGFICLLSALHANHGQVRAIVECLGNVRRNSETHPEAGMWREWVLCPNPDHAGDARFSPLF